MAVTLSLFAGAGAQFFTNFGTVLTGGKIYTYAAGTTTPQPAYTTSSGNVAWTNPIVLDAAGRVPSGGEIWLTTGIGYKFVLKDSNDVLIATYDNIPSSAQPPAANDADSIMYEQGYTVTAGNFVVGKTYRILSVGDTNFTLIGAASNTVGVHFIATGVGSGTGTAELSQTVESRLRQTVSVKDFGAVGDGLTDDTNAFIAAIAAANAIFVPTGTYLITSTLTLKSNLEIYGGGTASIIKLGANNIVAFSTYSVARSGIVLRDMLIDGGGQTSNIYTGYKGNIGVYVSNAMNVKISNLTVQKMGVVKQSNPIDDNGIGGYGILVEARHGPISDIHIDKCTVKNIAGGGYYTGDGIYVAGYSSTPQNDYVNTTITDCWVSTVARHCYGISGGEGLYGIGTNMMFNNCYGEKSALDGFDVEDGNSIIISNCVMSACGNDQTYYDPVAIYGANYPLLAGISTSNNSSNIAISDCVFRGCYYGINYGSTDGLKISNCTAIDSTTSDIMLGTAAAPSNLQISNCTFRSDKNTLGYYRTDANSGVSVTNTVFYGTVLVVGMQDGSFSNCTFKKGFAATGGSGDFARNKFIGCEFGDWAGVGLRANEINAASADCIVDSCVFNGTGNMTVGVAFAFNSAYRWKINNCKFIGCTTAGIIQSNGNGQNTCDVTNCHFDGCADGISIVQSIRDSLFAGNYFRNISGWCFGITGIDATTPMPNGPTIVNNKSGDSCTNGLRITLSGLGSYDYTILLGNNFHSCTGTKWNLGGGNSNGIVANNITT